MMPATEERNATAHRYIVAHKGLAHLLEARSDLDRKWAIRAAASDLSAYPRGNAYWSEALDRDAIRKLSHAVVTVPPAA